MGEATRSGIPVYREAIGSAKIAPHKVATDSRENRDRTVATETLEFFPGGGGKTELEEGTFCWAVQTYYALKHAFQRTKTLR